MTPLLTAVGAWAATAAMASAPETMAQDVVRLAAAFPEPDRAAWLALVDKTLKGAPLQSLTRRTIDGLPIEALYQASEAAAPIVRASAGWDVRAVVRASEPAAANAEALADLAQGATSVLL